MKLRKESTDVLSGVKTTLNVTQLFLILFQSTVLNVKKENLLRRKVVTEKSFMDVPHILIVKMLYGPDLTSMIVQVADMESWEKE